MKWEPGLYKLPQSRSQVSFFSRWLFFHLNQPSLPILLYHPRVIDMPLKSTPSYQSAVHRALGLDEILRAIIRHVRKSRHALALTCRAFLEPSLDAIWHTLEGGIDPLLQLFPEDVLKVVRNDVSNTLAIVSGSGPT